MIKTNGKHSKQIIADWEIVNQHDAEHGSVLTKRLAVPGGWLYMVSIPSPSDQVLPPVFVQAHPRLPPPEWPLDDDEPMAPPTTLKKGL